MVTESGEGGMTIVPLPDMTDIGGLNFGFPRSAAGRHCLFFLFSHLERDWLLE
jgi:hypothetical protein